MKKIYRIFCLIAGSSLIASTSFAYSVGTKNSNNQSSYDLTDIPIKHPSVNFENVLQKNGRYLNFKTFYSKIECTYSFDIYTHTDQSQLQKECPKLKIKNKKLNIPYTISTYNNNRTKYNLSNIFFLSNHSAMILFSGDSRNPAIMQLSPPGHLRGVSVSHENIKAALCYNIKRKVIAWDPNKNSWLPCRK